MADNDRWRDDQERMGGRGSTGRGRRLEDDRGDGSIARRGFGNDRSGFERGGSYMTGRRDFDRRDFDRRDFDRQDYSRQDYSGDDTRQDRDFGDSAGYGSGGSARDWRDVVGDDRGGGRERYGSGYDRAGERGSTGGPGAPFPGYEERDAGFGRGSRDHDDRGFFERVGDEIRSVFGDDEGGGPNHRGRGPKGYQRSDQRILDELHDRLTDDPHVDASEIEVRVENREVTLNGTVNSRFEKRHAEDIAESVSGVAHVQNNLRVQQADVGGSSMGAGGTGTAMGATSSTGDAGRGRGGSSNR
jgi:osmotically-inducible protein OsmY